MYKIGDVIGKKYEIVDYIGAGGNGTVFKVRKIDEPQVLLALKVIKLDVKQYYRKNLKYNKSLIKYRRFQHEIKVVKEYQSSIEGILPILDLICRKNHLKIIYPGM